MMPERALWLVPGQDHPVFGRFAEFFGQSFASFEALDYRALYLRHGPGETERRIEEGVRKAQANVVLFTQFPNSYGYLSPECLRRLGKASVVIGLGFDDEMYFEQAKYFYQACAAVITTDVADAGFLQQIGVAAQPALLPLPGLPGPAEGVVEDIDVSFIGDMSKPGRKAAISRLEAAGIQVQDYGRGSRHGWLDEAEVAAVTARSKISLNFTATNAPEWILRHDPLRGRLGQIKGRAVALAAMRKFCLCEWSPCIPHWFEPDQEVGVFADADDLATQARRYLADAALRHRMAQAAHDRYQRQYALATQWPRVFSAALRDARTGRNLVALPLGGPLFRESMGRSRGVGVLHALRRGALLRTVREPFSRWSLSLDYWRGICGGIVDTLRAHWGMA